MNDYPLILPEHSIKEFANEFLTNNRNLNFIKSYFHKKDNFPIGMHSHKFYEINIVTDSIGIHYIEKYNFHTEKGDVFVIPPGFRHGYWQLGDLQIFHILLSPAFFQHYSQELKSCAGYATLFEIEPYLRTDLNNQLFLKLDEKQFKSIFPIFTQLADVELNAYEGSEVIKNSLALYVIANLCNFMSQNHSTSAAKQHNANTISIVNAMVYIKENFNKKITITELTEIAHLSRSTFLRHFFDICKCTPSEYIINCRLYAAAQLLETTDKLIIDIAMDCGFFDSSHLNRFFIKKYNQTPYDYRVSKNKDFKTTQ